MKELSFHEKLLAIQQELNVPKNQFNSFGNYKYRSLEDIMEAVKPLLKKYKLVLLFKDSTKTSGDYSTYPTSVKVGKEFIFGEIGAPIYIESKAILLDGEDGQCEVTASAGVDVSKSGMDMAQSFGSSSSYARKYAANGLFLIDDTKDSDVTNKHGKQSPVKKIDLSHATYLKLHKAIKALPLDKRLSAIEATMKSPKYKLTEEVVNGLKELIIKE